MDAGQPRRLRASGVAAAFAILVIVAVLSVARPVAAADPLPSLPAASPSLPVAVPSVPLPTVPIATPKPPTLPPPPTVPVPTLPPPPTLPVPTPTLPLPTPTLPPPPTPTLPVPTPTLPVGTPAPTASQPASTGTLPPTTSASPGSSGLGAGPLDSGKPLSGPSGGPVGASEVPTDVTPAVESGPSLFDSIGVPGLVIGVPLIVLLGILGTQLAVGAAWLPVIRRWLDRRV